MKTKVVVEMKERPIVGANICYCSKGDRQPIDLAKSHYDRKHPDNYEFSAGAPTGKRVIACDACKGAILYKGMLQELTQEV